MDMNYLLSYKMYTLYIMNTCISYLCEKQRQAWPGFLFLCQSYHPWRTLLPSAIYFSYTP